MYFPEQDQSFQFNLLQIYISQFRLNKKQIMNRQSFKSQKKSEQKEQMNPQQVLIQAEDSKIEADEQTELTEIMKKSKERILKSSRFKVCQELKSSIEVRVTETNFESMKVQLHYGNFVLEVSVIFTEIDERLFEDGSSERGTFGVVYFVEYEGVRYAIKGIPFVLNQDGVNAQNAYKEYFLFCLADVLEVGPKMFKLFGFDLLLTKKMVFFSMEECKPIREQQIGPREFQLRKNLQILHSLKFVHRDIKPANISYSKYFKKYVFLDFGLSELINQAPGTKTYTKFRGTLFYCSQEMRKCYFLADHRFIDLYKNDLYGLQKCFQTFKGTISGINQSQFNDFIKNEEQQIFNQIISALKLKYFIKDQNILQISMLLDKSNNIISTVYQIFSCPQIPAIILKNKEIQEKINIIKTQIFTPGFKTNQADALLCNFFSQDKIMMSAQKIIPTYMILQSKPEFFNKQLANLQLIVKLFHFFQPFQQKNLNFVKQKFQLKKVIVNRICELKKPAFKEPICFSQKIRFALVYFYENLRNYRNLKILFSLRLLFLSIQEYIYKDILQREIIQLISDPFLKMLKLSEFIFFLGEISEGLKQKMKNKWITIIQNLSLDYITPKCLKIKSFLDVVLTKQNILKDSFQFQKFVGSLIKEIDQQCASAQEKQSIYLIKHIFVHLCKLNHSIFSKEPPKGLALHFYSRTLTTIKVKLSYHEQREQQLFRPFNPKKVFVQETSRQLIVNTIENLFQVHKKRGLFISYIIMKFIRFNFVSKSYMYILLRKMEETFKNQESLNFYQNFYAINYCLDFLRTIQRNAAQNQKIQSSEKAYFVLQLERFLIKTIQSSKQIIESSVHLKIYIKILQIKLCFGKGETVEKMRTEFEDLMSLLYFQPKQQNLIIPYIFSLFTQLEVYLKQPEDHFIKRIFVQFCEHCFANHNLLLFRLGIVLFSYFIRIKNQQGKEEENLAMILSIMDYVGPTKQSASATKIQTQFFQMGMRAFCHTIAPWKLAEIYSRLRFKQQEFACGFYAYFLFEIFLKAKDSASQAQQLRQTTRTTLCLGSMSWNCQMKVKSDIFKFYRTLVCFKSKRRALVFRRSEIRSTADSGRVKMFVREFENRVEKASRKNVERALGKLIEKIRNLAKL